MSGQFFSIKAQKPWWDPSAQAPKKEEPKKEEPKGDYAWPDKKYYDLFPTFPVTGGPSSTAFKFAIGHLVDGSTPAARDSAGNVLDTIAFPVYAVPGEMRTSWNAVRCLVDGRMRDGDDPALSSSMGWALAGLAEEAQKKQAEGK